MKKQNLTFTQTINKDRQIYADLLIDKINEYECHINQIIFCQKKVKKTYPISQSQQQSNIKSIVVVVSRNGKSKIL